MNYLFLKNIIETLEKTFVCPNCKIGTPKDETLEVASISHTGVEIVFVCPNCQEKSHVKAETSQIPLQFLQTEK